jgi:hypothetical protein
MVRRTRSFARGEMDPYVRVGNIIEQIKVATLAVST